MDIRRAILRRIGAALVAVPVIGAAGCALADTHSQPGYSAQRIQMVREVAVHALLAAEDTGIAEFDPRIMEAIGDTPRHEFVPEKLRDLAYVDTPLPIGQGQSIAQPFLVALMTQLVQVGENDLVFETGTGAGYHAAVLSRLARRVISVEVVAPLALRASATLKRLNYDNVTVIASDGYYGAPAHAPFDAIIVKEAVDHLPPPLLAQLKRGGRMVIPIGPRNGPQFLTLVEKNAAGGIRKRRILAVRFTPLQGGQRI